MARSNAKIRREKWTSQKSDWKSNWMQRICWKRKAKSEMSKWKLESRSIVDWTTEKSNRDTNYWNMSAKRNDLIVWSNKLVTQKSVNDSESRNLPNNHVDICSPDLKSKKSDPKPNLINIQAPRNTINLWSREIVNRTVENKDWNPKHWKTSVPRNWGKSLRWYWPSS